MIVDLKSISYKILVGVVLAGLLIIAKADASKHASPTFLFTLYAKKAYLTNCKVFTCLLVLPKTRVTRVFAMSDKPYRMTRLISPQELGEIWPKGKMSFVKDYPNAVLSAYQSPPIIVVVKQLKVTERDFRLVVQILGKQPQKFSKPLMDAVLTIDNYSPPNGIGPLFP